MSDPQYYRRKAQEMRDSAQRFHEPSTVRAFHRLAEDFDRLAEFTEAQVTLTRPRYRYGASADDDSHSVTASNARNRR